MFKRLDKSLHKQKMFSHLYFFIDKK